LVLLEHFQGRVTPSPAPANAFPGADQGETL